MARGRQGRHTWEVRQIVSTRGGGRVKQVDVYIKFRQGIGSTADKGKVHRTCFGGGAP